MAQYIYNTHIKEYLILFQKWIEIHFHFQFLPVAEWFYFSTPYPYGIKHNLFICLPVYLHNLKNWSFLLLLWFTLFTLILPGCRRGTVTCALVLNRGFLFWSIFSWNLIRLNCSMTLYKYKGGFSTFWKIWISFYQF